jgi:hypothetical protein
MLLHWIERIGRKCERSLTYPINIPRLIYHILKHFRIWKSEGILYCVIVVMLLHQRCVQEAIV